MDSFGDKNSEERQEAALIHDDETVDALLKGKLRIIQKKKGYRFSLDAVLLAHFAVIRPGETVFDLGTGSGVIPIIISTRSKPRKIVGLEVQKDMADMAERSIRLNGLEKLIEIVLCDVNEAAEFFQQGISDVVICNPPYRRLHSGRMNPDTEKAVARHEIKGGIEEFIRAASYLLKPKGRCYVIYKARRLAKLFLSLNMHGIEPKKMRMVHSKPGSEGEFVLLEGMKKGGEELRVAAPLVIYESDGSYSAEMQAVFAEIDHSPL